MKMSGNGLISQYMVGASATQTEEGPCNPKGLAPEVSQIWDELRKHIDTDAWRSSNQYLFQTLCELILQSRTLAFAAREQPLETKITRSWLAVVDQVRKLATALGLCPKSRTRLDSETDEFERWNSHDRN